MQPGDRIGPYRIEKRLGEGGIGEVFRAFDESLERNVAIKRLRPELAARETLVARFRLEAQTLARLNHPNIATLYALTHDAGSMYMVMEYVEGETVSALLRQRGPLALEPALRLAFQALSGIGYAHGRGVIHRDIKGANLMLDASGTLKIMDFGIARVLGGARHTRAGQMIGTPEFMAPEQIRGEDADERSDLYSLAILLYALLAGRAPFRARSEYQVMKAQVETPPPPLRDRMPELPRELDEVLRRALAKDPDDRFQSAAEMRAALAPLGHDSWADGPLHWPTRPPGARERVLDADDALELEAPTEVAEGSPIASELPLIEAELIDAEPADEAPPTARPTLLPLERLARLGAFAGRPQLVLAGFALGALLGLDLVVVEPTGLAARAAAGAHSTAIRPLRTPLAPVAPPLSSLSAASPRAALAASLFAPASTPHGAPEPSPIAPLTDADPGASTPPAVGAANEAKADAGFDRSEAAPGRRAARATSRRRPPADATRANRARSRANDETPAAGGSEESRWEIRWR